MAALSGVVSGLSRASSSSERDDLQSLNKQHRLTTLAAAGVGRFNRVVPADILAGVLAKRVVGVVRVFAVAAVDAPGWVVTGLAVAKLELDMLFRDGFAAAANALWVGGKQVKAVEASPFASAL